MNHNNQDAWSSQRSPAAAAAPQGQQNPQQQPQQQQQQQQQQGRGQSQPSSSGLQPHVGVDPLSQPPSMSPYGEYTTDRPFQSNASQGGHHSHTQLPGISDITQPAQQPPRFGLSSQSQSQLQSAPADLAPPGSSAGGADSAQGPPTLPGIGSAIGPHAHTPPPPDQRDRVEEFRRMEEEQARQSQRDREHEQDMQDSRDQRERDIERLHREQAALHQQQQQGPPVHPMQQGTQRSPPSPRSHTPLQHPSQSMQPGQPPIQSHAGTIHLHAPVASKIPPSFPGPNNLLASLNTPSQASGAPGQTPVSAALGGPPTSTGPAPERSYSGHPASGQLREQESDAGLRGYMHPLHGPPLMSSSKQHPMSHQSQHSPFGQMPGSLLGPGGPMPPATNAGPVTPAAGSAILDNPNMGAGVTLAQGQQPILDDALTYLDQVKVKFVDQPDVYNKFLDIMKDFKSQTIDTPGVIQRVSTLFTGHPSLIQGFNTFLPPGYRIECGTDGNPDAIRVTTPSGTNTLSMHPGAPPIEISGPRGEYYSSVRGWAEQAAPPPPPGGPYSPRNRGALPPNIYGQHPAHLPPGHSGIPRDPFDYPHPDHIAASQAQANQAQEQYERAQAQNRGPGLMQPPGMGVPPPPPPQSGPLPMSGLAGIGSGMLHGQSAQQAAAAQQGQVLADGKRGPVEFNHAINYVNKIKNRFSDSPEIYKQFLEILQTYQRESKPIQDVYAQVTVLFNSAPDLLEDFKQFLPESAAATQTPTQQPVQPTPGRGNYATLPPAQAGGLGGRQPQMMLPDDIPLMHSDIRNEPGYAAMAAGGARGSPVMGGQRMPETGKMPPMGQFHVKESYKDVKKRRANASAAATSGAATGAVPAGVPLPMPTGDAGAAGRVPQAAPLGNANKRTKLSHKAQQEAGLSVSPTLIPALPEPIPPTFSFAPSSEEYAFFDRVKKFIGNKQTFGEFLKLCNLYSADLIDKNVLVNRAQGFIGANPEIMAWFKRFMHVEPVDELIEPQARMEAASTSAPVTLAHCRALGPSYRLLPKRERQKPCSGRDELCQSVLNDEWASHPTWESEDSGFVAHRKNQFEDALHRIEEDRHEYDHHIEGCVRTIQLMEPLVQQLAGMTQAEIANFKLPPGLGGQSETIYRRVIKKVYDRAVGESVIEKMFSNPASTLPIVLKRLKQKCEEWKLCQREWDKVWREQMQRSFWKSLDHQANTTKSADKKLFVAKHIQNEITAKLEESKNLRKSGFQTPPWQFEYEFSDSEVLLDTTHLLLCHIERNSAGFGADPNKVMSFLKDFVPAMFGLDRDAFKTALREGYDDYGPSSENGETNDSTDEATNDDVDSVASKSRRAAAASSRKLDLLRDVLERQGENAERSRRATPISGASTPAQVPRSVPMDLDGPEIPTLEEITPSKWMEHPGTGNFNATESREFPLNAPYKKKVHTMYANVHIYCFLHSFEVLYSRLLRVKLFEDRARTNIQRAAAPKAAYKLGMIDKAPSDYLYDTSPDASYYQQVVRMCEEIIKGDMEQSHLEETLRRFFLQVGWQLYNLDKILVGIARFAGGIFNPDPKDKSSDIMALFFKEREKKETTHYQEIQYRKSVERLIREGDLYRITFIPATKKVTVQLMSAEDSTLDSNELSAEARWSYYVSAYSMRDPTEGVPISRMRLPFLQRTLPSRLDHDDDEYNQWFSPLINHDKLVIRICATSYHIRYEANTEDWFYRLYTPQQGEGTEGRSAAEIEAEHEREQAAIRDRRRDRFKRKFVNNPVWARGLSKDDVDLENQNFRSWVSGGSGAQDGKVAREEDIESLPENVEKPFVHPTTEWDTPSSTHQVPRRKADEDQEMADAPGATDL